MVQSKQIMIMSANLKLVFKSIIAKEICLKIFMGW